MTEPTIREIEKLPARYINCVPSPQARKELKAMSASLKAAGLTQLIHIDLDHFYFQITPETVEAIRAGAVRRLFSVARRR